MAEVLQLRRVAARLSGQRASRLPGLPPDARRLGRLLAARPDSAVLLVSRRRRAAVFGRARVRRRARRSGRLFGHALWRSVVLIALGIFLRSMHSRQTNFTFEDTLTQIGLGYPFLFLLAFRSVRAQWTALAVDPCRLLAGVGALSGRRSGIRLSGRRRAGRLAASLQRARGALEQEHQPRAGVRRVVPEPVSARRRRLWPTAAAT